MSCWGDLVSLNRLLSRAARRPSPFGVVADRRHDRVDQDQAAGHRATIGDRAGNYESRADPAAALARLRACSPVSVFGSAAGLEDRPNRKTGAR